MGGKRTQTGLTEKQKQAWALIWAGMSFRQAARELGVSKGTIQQRVEAVRKWRRTYA
jgi:transposase